MYRHILVPIDGNPTRHNGLDEATPLAPQTGASVRVFHAIGGQILRAAPELGMRVHGPKEER